MLTSEQLNHAFEPVFVDIRERSTVVERFIDRNLFRLYMATLWANVVLSPEEAGIEEEDLPTLHDLVVAELVNVIGPGADLESVFRFFRLRRMARALEMEIHTLGNLPFSFSDRFCFLFIGSSGENGRT